ncbi:MAG: aminomethyl-transferring glycine dehydrogenase [Rhodospirillaceae bacterium]|nr:aminomethyl-transferring glycine dehydrogenase [Rhodospirillaceae bacterium]MYB13156.1 aminomethyl-transferring glycine dehydrogenase [Rhodospirillaceae bacterium]MYI48286.1 aminomethyl-transferring glycine dehydrogenase [Rhodospirillaceae bacterium]
MPSARYAELEDRDSFIGRHIGPGPDEIAAMLETVGADSLDALIEEAVPAAIRDTAPLPLGEPATENAALLRIGELAAHNTVAGSLIGMGYHDTVVPPVIRRNVLENPAWYTAYTPYQPEISQGRLEALLNFQTMVADLTGMEIANASLLDEATAAAEAMIFARKAARAKSDRFLVSDRCHPQTLAVLQTRAAPLGIELEIGEVTPERAFGALGILIQYPDTFGQIDAWQESVKAVRGGGGLAAVATDLLALTLLEPPGAWGADIAIGSAQRFGVPMGFGGPHAAFFATRDRFARKMPGRLVGVSVDTHGRPGLRLALQTREQHIRREKATSNICTAQVLLANMAGFYGVWHGPDGLERIARRVHRLSCAFADMAAAAGLEAEAGAFFDTVTVRAPGRAEEIVGAAMAAGLNLRFIDGDRFGVAFDEACGADELLALSETLTGAADAGRVESLLDGTPDRLPDALRRRGSFMTHPVFHRYRSETEMMRYLQRLAGRDLALDRAMIPLGSCTMKLNAAAEMEPVSWPEFAGLHPFAPLDQADGTLALIEELEDMLCAATGFDAVSLQPNAGSQGELAGLLVIRAWHESRGDGARDICLIPSSAHGTNPASAVLAGFSVVVVGCDADGNIDIADLRARAEEHRDRLAALMVTYPSTHGVFEAGIVEICDIVHGCGGQVYMDGANLNALLGIARPGEFGPDVAHMNLHKTFCIPHGGGGPGVGPIGVKDHLAPFLPGHPVHPECGGEQAIGPVSAAPWGSAGILPISWAYIVMMGAAGLKRATAVAILNANYIAARLGDHFPVLYTGSNGRVAHECIVDLRPLRDFASVEDVAKRLIDYGFHAPTMSFPVAGTLMIEPTESESRAEIDRFCDAMIAIRREIARIEAGDWPVDDNPLANAPHTAEDLVATDWPHPYSRECAAFPAPGLKDGKYWPPVGRIDNVYGDRNIVCACPPLEAYGEAAE